MCLVRPAPGTRPEPWTTTTWPSERPPAALHRTARFPAPLLPLAAIKIGASARVSGLVPEPQESNHGRTFAGARPPLAIERVASIPGRGRKLD